MSERHRKDIRHSDFTLLARFCNALWVLEKSVYQLTWELGRTGLWLPVWMERNSVWILLRYERITMEAYGIETADFRRICRYLRVKESQLIDTLFRLSMLSVVPNQSFTCPRQFRQQFIGTRMNLYGEIEEKASAMGFIIERRRAEGKFRSKKVREQK